MLRNSIGCALALTFLLPALVAAQSLGEVAKKEKKRREENKQQGAQVRVVQEKEVSVAETEEPPMTGEPDDVVVSDLPIEAGEAASSSSSDREREEAKWRSRFSEARSRQSAARKRYDDLNSLHLSHGEYYVDEQGKPVITSLEELRRMVGQAKADLDQADRALEDLLEEARRAGVPPGWLR